MNKQIKKGNLNFDQSGRAYPDNPQIKENWDCIWENDGRYYELIGDTEHKEWEQVKVEVRELELGERQAILEKKGYRGLLHSNVKKYKSGKKIFEVIRQTCDSVNTPTREISLTYNNQTEVIYE